MAKGIEEEKEVVVKMTDALIRHVEPCKPENSTRLSEPYENLLGMDTCSAETKNFLIKHGILQRLTNGKQNFSEA